MPVQRRQPETDHCFPSASVLGCQVFEASPTNAHNRLNLFLNNSYLVILDSFDSL